RKQLGSPSGTQRDALGWPEVHVSFVDGNRRSGADAGEVRIHGAWIVERIGRKLNMERRHGAIPVFIEEILIHIKAEPVALAGALDRRKTGARFAQLNIGAETQVT